MSAWAIVLAAGSGSRFGGDRPKLFERLAGRRVLDWSVQTARLACDGVILVVSADHSADHSADDRTDVESVADAVVVGGATRSDSVRAGLAALPSDCEVVAIHDGARPLATTALYAAVLDAVRAGADGALPGVAVTDTIKRVEGAVVVETLDRDSLVAVQTPQAFRVDVLRAAHLGGAGATDDGALVEAAGGKVVIVPSNSDNLKITHRADLERAEALVRDRVGEL
jgi:2-C-methyl-D-erythritol 4-phosphate cytidylyltransferase